MAETVVINIEANTSGLQTTIDALSKIGVIEKKIVDEFKATNEKNLKSTKYNDNENYLIIIILN